MRKMRWQIAGLVMLSAALLSMARASDTESVDGNLAALVEQGTLAPLSDQAPAEVTGRFDASTVSADGTSIAFTVYVPDIAIGNSAPLLIEGHGWGGRRTRDLDTTAYDDVANTPLQTAKLALHYGPQGGKQPTRGWYVISFDQRGFGDSGGFANVMDPQLEGRDVQAIIDWAQANLPRLAYRKGKDGLPDPVVGGVGLSYGGGFQTIGAGVDRRFDALVPTTTWYDLRYSLYEPPKSGYLALLAGVGVARLGRPAPFTYQALVDASTSNQISANYSRKLYLSSPISYCEGNSPDMQQPAIPAFFIHAASDILFNLNEGFLMFECYRRANAKSKFLAVRFGHPNILLNDRMPKFTEEHISCGKGSLPVARLAFSFLAQNLVDSRLDGSYSSDYLTLPELRMVLDDGNPANGPQGETAEGKCYEVAKLGPNPSGAPLVRHGGISHAASPSAINGLIAGVPAPLVSVIQPNDPATLQSAAMAAFTGPEAGQLVTLVPASGSERMLVGMPTVQLDIAAADPAQALVDNPPILFLGLVRRNAAGGQQLMHNQILPVIGYGKHSVTLPGISMLLHGSDELRLVVFGYHPQYFNFYTRVPVSVNVSGISAALPFVN